jgi:hypothetical protein
MNMKDLKGSEVTPWVTRGERPLLGLNFKLSRPKGNMLVALENKSETQVGGRTALPPA